MNTVLTEPGHTVYEKTREFATCPRKIFMLITVAVRFAIAAGD
jgi:hypothetical protein